MSSGSTLRLIGLAIAGILVAAAVAVVASQLASRQIGLASEPVSAGDQLAPASARRDRDHRQPKDERKAGEVTTPATTERSAPPTSTEAAPPAGGSAPSGDDSGGGESGSGGDGNAGGDD